GITRDSDGRFATTGYGRWDATPRYSIRSEHKWRSSRLHGSHGRPLDGTGPGPRLCERVGQISWRAQHFKKRAVWCRRQAIPAGSETPWREGDKQVQLSLVRHAPPPTASLFSARSAISPRASLAISPWLSPKGLLAALSGSLATGRETV